MSDTEKVNGTTKLFVDEYTPLTYFMNRDVLQQEDIALLADYERKKPTVVDSAKQSVRDFKCMKLIKETIPVVEWIPKYSVKQNLMGDLMAGITVAVMHIPQGMAYGLLAGLTPSVGLYMAFFPTLAYFLFGTSRHISTGTFAVISIMVSKIVNTYATINTSDDISAINGTQIPPTVALDPDLPQYTNFEVATAVTLVAGLYQLLMCFLRLGTLASLLSKPLVNAFTTAAAIHVLVSQMKDLFGLQVPRYNGAFKLVLTTIDIIKKIAESNVTTIIVSLIVMGFMIFMNEYVKPKLATKCRLPVPAELIAVVGATLASYLLELGPKYNVRLVGNIPLGLPAPVAPPLELIKVVAVDSIAVTIVSYSIGISMALIFAQKQCYEVRPNQELFAFGISNIVGSLFSCIPLACSLSRSVIQEQTGGKTQVTSVISAGLILVLLLWLGPFFETLPKCVLAGIIIVALKSMFMQVKDLKRFSQQSTLEAIVWLVTFFGVVLIDIDIGLLIGVCLSLVVLYIKGYKSYSYLLGEVPDTGIYVDLKTHKNAIEVPKVKIFRYVGAINFASRSTFKKELRDAIKVDHRVIRRASMISNTGESSKLVGMRSVIVDLSTVPHLDFAACQVFTEIQKELDLLGCTLVLTNPQDSVYDTLIHAHILREGPFKIYASIHDAVLYLQHENNAIIA